MYVLHVYMCVCVHVIIYVCMFICTYVCMYVTVCALHLPFIRFGLAYADYKCAVLLDGLFERGKKSMARWVA